MGVYKQTCTTLTGKGRRFSKRREARIVDFDSSDEDNKQAVVYKSWMEKGTQSALNTYVRTVIVCNAFGTTTGKELRRVGRAIKGKRTKEIDSSDDETKETSESKEKYRLNPPKSLTGPATSDVELPLYANGEATDTDTSEPNASASPVRHVAHTRAEVHARIACMKYRTRHRKKNPPSRYDTTHCE